MADGPIWVHVCTWDPAHTLARMEAQQAAVRDGTVARLVKEHGRGTEELARAVRREQLTTMGRTLHGELSCSECGALMERVIGKSGITDRLEVVRDVSQHFDEAIDRTRKAR